MAEVWQGQDQTLGRTVAVKILHPHLAVDRSFLDRFRREAVAAARLAHPNIVSTYDTGVDSGLAFIVMEMVNGQTLRDALVHHNALSPGRAVHVAAQVADALQYAHRAGIVHRDVKPANILLCEDGRVKVTDFGIVKAAPGPSGPLSGGPGPSGPLSGGPGPSGPLSGGPGPSGPLSATSARAHEPLPGGDLTATGAVVGTAKYFSPEQSDGRPLDGRSDIYALGVVLYEMVCGRPPFTGGNDVAIALQHVGAVPVSPRQVRAGIPRPLETVILRALAKLPGDRYATAGEMQSAMLSIDLASDDALAMVVRDTTPPRGIPPTFVQSERSALVPAVLIVLVAVALGVLGVLFARSDTGKRLLDSPRDGSHEAVTVAQVLAFDPPPGSGTEHDDELPFLLDDDTSTAWSTENYKSSRFGGLKEGVGVVLRADGQHKFGRVELTSPTRGWTAEAYVADSPRATPEAWGSPVDRKSQIDSSPVNFDLHGRSGGAVLIWITDLGGGNQSVSLSGARLTT